MRYITSVEELRKLLDQNHIVLVAFIGDDEESRSISYAVRFFEKIREPDIVVAIVNVLEHPDVAEVFGIEYTPTIRLYIDSRIVFEQKGGMKSYDKDVYVLKEGIKDVLRSRGIRFLV